MEHLDSQRWTRKLLHAIGAFGFQPLCCSSNPLMHIQLRMGVAVRCFKCRRFTNDSFCSRKSFKFSSSSSKGKAEQKHFPPDRDLNFREKRKNLLKAILRSLFSSIEGFFKQQAVQNEKKRNDKEDKQQIEPNEAQVRDGRA